MPFKEALIQGVFPGAVLLVGRETKLSMSTHLAPRSLVPTSSSMYTSLIFDLASLTKPLATTVAIMLLVTERRFASTIT